MPDLDLFERALGLQPPWKVVEDMFDAGQKRLDVRIDFAKGSRFPCPECERADCPVHDTERQTWRHLNFWQQCAARRLVVSPAQPGWTRRVVLDSDGLPGSER